jgi:hypothetical protein
LCWGTGSATEEMLPQFLENPETVLTCKKPQSNLGFSIDRKRCLSRMEANKKIEKGR